MQLIYIEWQDAFCNTGWIDQEDMESMVHKEECITREVGWVYYEDKSVIVIYARYCPESEGFGEKFGLVQKIPKTWIKKRIDITGSIEQG